MVGFSELAIKVPQGPSKIPQIGIFPRIWQYCFGHTMGECQNNPGLFIRSSSMGLKKRPRTEKCLEKILKNLCDKCHNRLKMLQVWVIFNAKIIILAYKDVITVFEVKTVRTR